jgi:hypothetical protein
VSEWLSPSALLLETPDPLLHVLDLRLNAANLLRNLRGALAVAVAPGFREGGVQVSEFLLKPLELVAQLGKLRASRVVRSLTRLTKHLPEP